jgi:aminodeoxyfutalosine synthase
MSASETDLATLTASHDIISIGMQADDVRRRRHGTRTTFVRVADVSATPGAPVAVPPGAGEIRIFGTPPTRAVATGRVAEVRAAVGDRPLSGFSLADLEQIAAVEGVTLRTLLEDLCAAGLELVAEAPFERLQDPRRSLEQVNIAGLALARLSIDRLPDADLLVHLTQVAQVQRSVGFIRAFAPLPRRVNPSVPTTGYDDVKRVALARIVVEDIPSIQVDWTLYGPKLAQVALTMGVDDLDGVSADDDQSEGRRRSPVEEIRRNIRAAGGEPVERNGRFELVIR